MMLGEKVRELVNGGCSIMEASRKLNVGYAKAYNAFKKIDNRDLLSRISKTRLSSQKERRKIQDKSELYHLYVKEKKSMKEISKYYGTTPATVLHTLRRFQIPTRLKNGKNELNSPRYSEEILRKLYYEEKMSLHEIAKVLGYNNGSDVKFDMEKLGIERRDYVEAGHNTYEQHPEKVELHRQQLYDGITGYSPYKDTWIELFFKEWCHGKGIGYVHQFQIEENTHRFDFLIQGTNTIVEMDGVFWHSLPEHKERDKRFEKYADDNGYQVIRITDVELKEQGEEVINERLENICQLEKV